MHCYSDSRILFEVLTEIPEQQVPYNPSKTRGDLIKLIVLDNQPLSIVENEGFQTYSAGLNPNVELPADSTIAQNILDTFHDAKMKLTAKLQVSIDKYDLNRMS